MPRPCRRGFPSGKKTRQSLAGGIGTMSEGSGQKRASLRRTGGETGKNRRTAEDGEENHCRGSLAVQAGTSVFRHGRYLRSGIRPPHALPAFPARQAAAAHRFTPQRLCISCRRFRNGAVPQRGKAHGKRPLQKLPALSSFKACCAAPEALRRNRMEKTERPFCLPRLPAFLLSFFSQVTLPEIFCNILK